MPIPEFEIPAEPRPEPKFARAKSNQGVCLEVFSGRAGLTLALKEAGLKCLTDRHGAEKGQAAQLASEEHSEGCFSIVGFQTSRLCSFWYSMSSLLKSTAQSGELEES